MNKSYKLPKNLVEEKRTNLISRSYRLSEETSNNIDNIAKENNMSKTKVIDIAIDNLMKKTI